MSEKVPTYYDRLKGIEADLKMIATLCVADDSFKPARVALAACELVRELSDTFPIEADEYEFGHDWTKED